MSEKICPIMSRVVDARNPDEKGLWDVPCMGSRCALWIHAGTPQGAEGFCGLIPGVSDHPRAAVPPFAHVTPFADPAAEGKP